MNIEALAFLVFAVVGLLIIAGGGLGGVAAVGSERQERQRKSDNAERYAQVEAEHRESARRLNEQNRRFLENGEGIYKIPNIDHFGQPPEIRPLTDATYSAPRLTARIPRKGLLPDWDCEGECRDVPPELPEPKG
jgi:hypothetical protein